MTYSIIAVVLWSALAASLLVTVVGFARRSWQVLWLAAGLTLFFTLPAALSVGPLGWLALLGTAILGWLIVVPGQLAFGPAPYLLVLIPLGIVAAVAATILGPSARRERAG